MRKTIKIMLVLVLAIALTFGVEVACQAPLLLSGETGVQQIDLSAAYVYGGEAAVEDEAAFDEWDEYAEDDYEDETESEYAEDEWAEETVQPGVLTAQSGQSIVIPYSGFVQTLTISGETVTENADYTVSCQLPDGSWWQTDSFFWAIGDESCDSVNIGRQVESMTVTFAQTGCTITDAQADNRFQFNPYRMMLVSLTVLCAGLLLTLRREIGRRLEIGFLIVALCVGVILSVGQPATTGNTYDDEIHFGRIAALAHGRPGYQTEAEFLLTERSFNVVYDMSYRYEMDTLQDQRRFLKALNEAGENDEPVVEVPLQLAFSDTGYITQALGYGLAQWAGLPMSGRIIMARVFNMLTYVLLTFLAIRTMKRFKVALAAIALMPAPMFQACSLTYDTTINALCFLGTALAVDAILDRDTRLTWQRGLGIMLTMVLGAISKVVYIPLLLLVLLLPRSKFSSHSARVWYKTLAVVLCILMVMTMMLSVSGGAVSLTDSRGDGADSGAQISYLLHHPLTYLVTFARTIWDVLEGYFLRGARTTMGYSAAEMSGTMSALSLLLVAFSIFTDHDPDMQQRLNWKQRLSMLIIGMMAVGMTFTTMYVAYTGVGADYIAGVQSRYLIPVLPLLAMLCSPDGIQNRMKKTSWHTLFCLLNGAVLLTVCWQTFGQYYL